MNGTITLDNVTKKFGNQSIINNLSMTIPGGSFTCLFGKSGQGKSVLLKIIIGLLEPTSGAITIDGKKTPKVGSIRDDGLSIGYVFQFAALLDSLTIAENITITCSESLSAQEKRDIALKALLDVGLNESTLDKYPSELSGGMKKRVGIARTLIQKPRIILYDEPTTGLDPVTTKQIHEVMKKVQVKHGVTTVVVSHDMGIIPYSDYIGILEHGACNFFAPTKDALAIKHPFLESFLEAGYPSKLPDFYSESFLI